MHVRRANSLPPLPKNSSEAKQALALEAHRGGLAARPRVGRVDLAAKSGQALVADAAGVERRRRGRREARGSDVQGGVPGRLGVVELRAAVVLRALNAQMRRRGENKIETVSARVMGRKIKWRARSCAFTAIYTGLYYSSSSSSKQLLYGKRAALSFTCHARVWPSKPLLPSL